MKKEDLDLSVFLYNPFSDEDIKRLENYEEFKVDIPNKKKVIRYIILMYDLNTPLRKEVLDEGERKNIACQLAGFKLTNNKFSKKIEDFLVGENFVINNMIIKYILLFSDPDYLLLRMDLTMYAIMGMKVLKGDFDRFDIDSNAKLNKRIKELTQGLFGGEESRNLRRALYKSIEDKRIALKPEDIAEKLAKGEDPLSGYERYEEGYKPDKHKYVSHK